MAFEDEPVWNSSSFDGLTGFSGEPNSRLDPGDADAMATLDGPEASAFSEAYNYYVRGEHLAPDQAKEKAADAVNKVRSQRLLGAKEAYEAQQQAQQAERGPINISWDDIEKASDSGETGPMSDLNKVFSPSSSGRSKRNTSLLGAENVAAKANDLFGPEDEAPDPYVYRKLKPDESYDPLRDIVVSDAGPNGAMVRGSEVISRKDLNPHYADWQRKHNLREAEAKRHIVSEARENARLLGSLEPQKPVPDSVLRGYSDLMGMLPSAADANSRKNLRDRMALYERQYPQLLGTGRSAPAMTGMSAAAAPMATPAAAPVSGGKQLSDLGALNYLAAGIGISPVAAARLLANLGIGSGGGGF